MSWKSLLVISSFFLLSLVSPVYGEGEWPEVKVIPAKKVTLGSFVSAPGKIVAPQVRIQPELSGRLVSIQCQMGQKVKKGQVLFVIDSQPYRLEYDASRAKLERAEARYQHFRNAYQKALRELGKEDKSKQSTSFQKLHHQVKEAKAQVRLAHVEVKQKQYQLYQTKIKSPLSGVMGEIHFTTGEIVQPGQVLGEMYDLSQMAVEANLLSSDAVKIKVGQQARIEWDQGAKKVYTVGKVSFISSRVKVHSKGTYLKIRLTLPNPKGLLVGLYVRLHFSTGKTRRVFLLPFGAILSRQGKTGVLVSDNQGKLSWQSVQLGRKLGQQVEVLKGLKEGERVAVIGNK